MILVSACLLGVRCRYDGASRPSPVALDMAACRPVLPVCPEQLGGLATPRPPAAIEAGTDGFAVLAGAARVLTLATGDDVTPQFVKGAEEVLRLCRLFKVEAALVKAKSPSCGLSGITGVMTAGLVLAGVEVREL